MKKIRKAHWRFEADQWIKNGSIVNSSNKLERIKTTLEENGPIIIEHWHYRRASSPSRLIIDEYDDFIKYLKTKTFAGDALDIWSWKDVCKINKRLAEGKIPDLDGCVPKKGVY